MSIVTICDRCGEMQTKNPTHVLDLWSPTNPKTPDDGKRDRRRYDLCAKCYGEILASLKETQNVRTGIDITATQAQPKVVVPKAPKDDWLIEEGKPAKEYGVGTQTRVIK